MTYEQFTLEFSALEGASAEERKSFLRSVLERETAKSTVRVQASFLLGELFYREGDFAQTIEVVEPIVLNYGNYPYSTRLLSCFNLVGVAAHCETDFPVARHFYRIALEVATAHDERFYFAFEHNNIALTYLAERKFAEAYESISMAERALPDCDEEMGAYVYVNKAIALQKLGRLDEALEAYETCVGRYRGQEYLPNDTDRCAATLFFKLGDFDSYHKFRQRLLDSIDEMDAPELIDACNELFECGMASRDHALLDDLFSTMDGFLERHPDEIRIELSVARLQCERARANGDKDALIDSLERLNRCKAQTLDYFARSRVASIDRRIELNREISEAIESRERANRAKERFLTNMSHDMRTPLNGIIGLLEIDEAHLDDLELMHENHRKMKAASHHLLSLVNDVLDMTKLDDRDVDLPCELMKIKQVTDEVASIVGEQATAAGIGFARECPGSKFPDVYGSPLHLRQLLLNVYSNCIKFNRPGGEVDTVFSCHETGDGFVTCRWVISDTGIGMSKEFLSHLFEPFAQEHVGARSEYAGTGLGMPIIERLLDRMGGTIAVSSELGQGSTFDISIPFKIASDTGKAPSRAGLPHDRIEGVNILLAEDNGLSAEIESTLLRDSGALVTVVSDGEAAVREFGRSAAGRYDIVLMDVMMPVLNGLEATEQIRRLPHPDAATVPIVALTANAFREDEVRCLEAGMDSYLAKPFDILKARRTICELISERHVAISI